MKRKFLLLLSKSALQKLSELDIKGSIFLAIKFNQTEFNVDDSFPSVPRFRLRYSPCSDTYLREWNDRALPRFGGEIRGWEKGVYSFESVERVVDAKKNLVSISVLKFL